MEKHMCAALAGWFPSPTLRRDRVLVKLQRLALGIRLDILDFVNPGRDNMTGAVMTRVRCDEQPRDLQSHTLPCSRKQRIHFGVHGSAKLKETTNPCSAKFLREKVFIDVPDRKSTRLNSSHANI